MNLAINIARLVLPCMSHELLWGNVPNHVIQKKSCVNVSTSFSWFAKFQKIWNKVNYCNFRNFLQYEWNRTPGYTKWFGVLWYLWYLFSELVQVIAHNTCIQNSVFNCLQWEREHIYQEKFKNVPFFPLLYVFFKTWPQNVKIH